MNKTRFIGVLGVLNFMQYLSVYRPKLIKSMLFSPNLMVCHVASLFCKSAEWSNFSGICGVTIDCPLDVIEQPQYEWFYNMLT